MKPQEMVLPSGRFAAIRVVTYGDFSAASKSADTMAELIARCVLIDGKSLTVQEVMDMEIEECMPITSVLTSMITKAGASKVGIA